MRIRTLASTLFLFLISAGTVNAATITTDYYFDTGAGFYVAGLVGSGTGFNLDHTDPGIINGFDSSLGTLTAVDISVSGVADLTVTTIFRDFFTVVDPWVQAAGSMYVGNTSLSLLGLPGISSVQATFNDRAGSCDDIGGPFFDARCELNFYFYDASFSASASITDAETLSLYTDTSFFTEVQQTADLTLGLISGTAQINAVFDTAGSVEVTYTYTPVPIPAAVWLFGSALIGLGWMRRKA